MREGVLAEDSTLSTRSPPGRKFAAQQTGPRRKGMNLTVAEKIDQVSRYLISVFSKIKRNHESGK